MNEKKTESERLTQLAAECTSRMRMHLTISLHNERQNRRCLISLIVLPIFTAIFALWGLKYIVAILQIPCIVINFYRKMSNFEQNFTFSRLVFNQYNNLHKSILKELLLPQEEQMRMKDIIKNAENTLLDIDKFATAGCPLHLHID